ncbi:MAG TPA: AraC family ligand binding domain-containing protein [Sandaracinaceae bacterium LLY-WYZ-13_1]|nr:AraC family ligand binding domain-containing protein [Sandaracinaceae bacterium LLY-WYZ-13_1]
MADWKLVDKPVTIPAPGGKLIEEIFGRVSTGSERLSVAHMVAPPNWSEPAQAPEFGELTVMTRGRMRIEVGDDAHAVELLAGQAFWVEPGVRVRYANPHEEEAEYYAVCLPAFAPDLAHRDEG